jgi:sulfur-oxidizing protein SoxX
MQKLFAVAAALVVSVSVSAALAQQKTNTATEARVDAAIKSSWATAAPEWMDRFKQDETIKVCSETRNAPSTKVSNAIRERERKKVEYPADGKLMGDWKSGEKIAQSGYGLRFSDYPARRPTGGNCYACHQIDKKEVSYGTIGPSLAEYGKIRKFKDEEIKAAYEKIYDPHVALPCSNMPRFGVNKVLTIDQIKDLVALLMSPDSPVNK